MGNERIRANVRVNYKVRQDVMAGERCL